MVEQNNIPDAEDTKTRVTTKISASTPGKRAPQIDLGTKDSAAPDQNTMTRRTLKLQSLAGMTGAPKAAAAAPVVTAASADTSDDTRTRRTVKLASLASAPAVKPLAVSPAAEASQRRTQKLEALDTQDVVALSEADLDTTTRKTVKISAAAPPPPPPVVGTPKPRQTVKVEGIAPVHTPVIDLDAKVGDTNTRKTVKLTVPESTTPDIDLNAESADDTRTKKSTKIDPVKFSAGSVDDTVKLQRPAPKPAMPGSVAPAAQSGASAVGGIKLNKPAAPAAAPAPAPAAAPAAAAPAAPAAAPAPAPEEKKKGLKVNTDALKDLGSAPMVQGDSPVAPTDKAALASMERAESKGINITFAVFTTLAALFMIFVALVAVTDYFNIWHPSESGRVDLPIISDYVYSNLK